MHSGIVAFRVPWIQGIQGFTIETVFAILAFFLLAALFPFLALFAAIAHNASALQFKR